jgi:hypothetical protein
VSFIGVRSKKQEALRTGRIAWPMAQGSEEGFVRPASDLVARGECHSGWSRPENMERLKS